MEQVIHIDQTYCVPERSIFVIIFPVWDVIEVSRKMQIQIYKFRLYCHGSTKGIQQSRTQNLWRELEALALNSGFILKIKVLHNDIESVLKVNGGLCQPLKALLNALLFGDSAFTF